jgi:hypothetical protein
MAVAPNQPWRTVATEQQQFFYEALGDRDWDCYKRDVEDEYLERNLGHAIFGPPEKLPDSINGSTGNAGRYAYVFCQTLGS